MAIREGVVRVLLYLFDEHDVEEHRLVHQARDSEPLDTGYHDYLEAVTLFAMAAATDVEVDASYERHEPVEWI
jgi:hypothetical protein